MQRHFLIFIVAILLCAPSFASAASLTGAGVRVVALTVGYSLNAQTGVSGSASSTSSTEATATADIGTEINLGGGGDNADMKITADDAATANTLLSSSDDVQTSTDFAAYVKSEMQNDSNLKEVDTTDSSVTLYYQKPARFLGIFPAHITTEVSANADGTVAISYPWYAFLYATNDANLQTSLDAQVAALNATDATLSASQKAHLLDTVHVVLERD